MSNRTKIYEISTKSGPFLAAMSSSRSDVVTKFVRLSARPLFFSLMFLESAVWKVSGKCLEGCLEGLLKVSERSMEGVWRVPGRCLEGVWKVS